ALRAHLCPTDCRLALAVRSSLTPSCASEHRSKLDRLYKRVVGSDVWGGYDQGDLVAAASAGLIGLLPVSDIANDVPLCPPRAVRTPRGCLYGAIWRVIEEVIASDSAPEQEVNEPLSINSGQAN